MTTIAYKDGVLAADRQAWTGRGSAGHTTRTKIKRLESGAMIGVSSAIVGAGRALIDWVLAGEPMDATPELTNADVTNCFTMIMIDPEGGIRFWDDGFWPSEIEADFLAIGSGAKYAIGAMAAGASAAGAVTIAGRFDQFTGNGIDILRLDGRQE